MNWHPEALTPTVERALQALAGKEFLQNFYLGGGTGLALQLGHRVSADLDFFSLTRRLTAVDRHAIVGWLTSQPESSLIHEEEGTLHFRLRGARVSFLHYPYRLLRPPRRWRGILIAHPLDIGLMKLGALIGRGSRKDFLDLYALAHHRYPLPHLLRLAPRKFPHAKELPAHVLKALVYFEDAERERMPRLLTPMAWPEVRSYFEKAVRDLTTRWLRRKRS
jgi:hypothetical protein